MSYDEEGYIGKGKEVAKTKDRDAGMVATWGESDAEMLSSDEEDDDFKNGLCFMAKSSQVSSPSSLSDSDSDNDLESYGSMFQNESEALESLFENFRILGLNHARLKKKKNEINSKLGVSHMT